MTVPIAIGSPRPFWPLPDVGRKSWNFEDLRAKGERKHAGIDLYADRGSVVIAPESGKIVGSQEFNGPNAVALLFELDSGPVILFGEVERNSWKEFGLTRGSRVAAGQPLARVGINPGGGQMLHFEMYRNGTRQNASWDSSEPAPASLLDPTNYLRLAESVGDPEPVDTTPPVIQPPPVATIPPVIQPPPVDTTPPVIQPPPVATIPPVDNYPVGPRPAMAGIVGLGILFAALMLAGVEW